MKADIDDPDPPVAIIKDAIQERVTTHIMIGESTSEMTDPEETGTTCSSLDATGREAKANIAMGLSSALIALLLNS